MTIVFLQKAIHSFQEALTFLYISSKVQRQLIHISQYYLDTYSKYYMV
jgi:hypothetical protein